MRTEIDRHFDLRLLEAQVSLVFDTLYACPPDIDCADQLDGENLMLFRGCGYDEVPEIIAKRADCVPFFALVDTEVARYYLAGYILFFINRISQSRRVFPVDGFGSVFGVEFVTMMAFLSREDTIVWGRTYPALVGVLVCFLDALVNTAGFEFSDHELMEIRDIRERLLGG